MRKLLLFALSLSLTTPIISEAASTTSSDHRGLGAVTTIKKVKYRRKSFAKASMPGFKGPQILKKPVKLSIEEARESLHHEVHMANGKILKHKLIETKTNKVLFLGFPYGQDDYIAAADTAVKTQYTVAQYEQFIANHQQNLNTTNAVSPQKHTSPLKAAVASSLATTNTAAATPLSPYANYLSAAANSSTGFLSGELCYNYTSQTASTIIAGSALSSQGTASSMAGQFNASASIQGSYGLFSANENFSYSNNYQNSSASGNQSFNSLSVFQISNTLDPNYPLTQYGLNQQTTGSFAALCGDRFVDTLYVGMLITGDLNWSSATSSLSTTITNDLSGSYGLDSISTAVSNTNAQSASSSQMNFTITQLGGGQQAEAVISTAVVTNKNILNACLAGSTADCTTYVSNINAAVALANNDFITDLNASKTMVNGVSYFTDLSMVEPFPNGVQGPNALYLSTGNLGDMNVSSPAAIINAAYPSYLNAFTTNSALTNYTDQITNYLNLINQNTTLGNRANTLANNISQYTFNPNQEMNNIKTTLQKLGQVYNNDATAMLANVKTCLLTKTPTTALTDCAPVLNLYTTYNSSLSANMVNAWDWYNNSVTALENPTSALATSQTFSTSTSLSDLNSALQNTMALQYASYYTAINPQGVAWATQQYGFPNDVVWLNNLTSPWGCTSPLSGGICSPFTWGPTITDPQSLPALVTFCDQYWTGGVTDAWVNLLPIAASYSANASMFSPVTDYLPYSYSVYNFGFYNDTSFPPTPAILKLMDLSCVQNFDSPCEYFQQSNVSTTYRITNDIVPIANFFK